MKLISKFIKPYQFAMWIALFFTILELAVELYQPVIMAIIIDEGIVEGDLTVVYIWGAFLLALSLLAFIGGLINSFYAAKVSQGVGFDLRNSLFHKIQQFASHQLQKFPTSSLITRLTNDVTQIQHFIFMGLRIALRAPLFIIGGIIMAYTVHIQLAHILLLFVPVFLFITLWILKKGVVLFQQVQLKLDGLNRIIQENLLGIRLVKAFTRERFEEERFIQVNTSLLEDNKKALRLMELTMPLLMFGMNVAMIFIIWYGHVQLNIGSAQAGEIVAVINYATRILFSFGVFAFIMMNYSRAKASTTRITDVLKEHTVPLRKELEREPQIKGDIFFNNVSFGYQQDLVLADVTFQVHAGETVGIIGETGAGKSTLFQLIPRLMDVTAGEILVDGKKIEEYPLDGLRKQIGLVPQEAHLFSGTIRENIQWGKNNATEEEIIQAAKEAEIHDFIMTLPIAYDTPIGQRGVNFSGGQKQRLSIARALVRRPNILLLDDSTSALDAKTEARLLETLKRQSCTVLIIAQKISSVKEADQIILLQEGKLVAKGNHKALLKESDYYQKIYSSQAEEKGVGNFV